MIRRLGLAIMLVAAVPASLTSPASVASTAVAAERTIIADGHVDLGPRFVGERWRLQIRDDTAQPVVWRDVPDVVLHANDAAIVTVPPDSTFAFLGQAGATIWVLPQTQRPGILWPGWNTQDPSVIAKVTRAATWRLHGVNGPGHFALFLTGNFGAPQVLFDSARPYPQETGIESGSHVHGNWAFSAPGSYLLDVEMLATTMDGAAVTDRQTLRIFVGPGDAAAAFPTRSPISTPAVTSSSQPAVTPSTPQAVGAADRPAAEPRSTTWIVIGGTALAGVLAGVVLLVWLRHRRNRRTEGA